MHVESCTKTVAPADRFDSYGIHFCASDVLARYFKESVSQSVKRESEARTHHDYTSQETDVNMARFDKDV